MITRSDLTELTAAAAAVGIDDWPEDTLHLPNVPKGSRARSEVGIDVLAVRMDFSADDVELLADDMLFIGSVKHTVDDPGDCRYKLVKSVSPSDLTVPYVAQQLRILNGRLEMQGFNPRRLYLFLRDFPDADHVAVSITGAVDATLGDAFLEQMTTLPEVEGVRRCRHLLFEELGRLLGGVQPTPSELHPLIHRPLLVSRCPRPSTIRDRYRIGGGPVITRDNRSMSR